MSRVRMMARIVKVIRSNVPAAPAPTTVVGHRRRQVYAGHTGGGVPEGHHLVRLSGRTHQGSGRFYSAMLQGSP